MLFTQNLTLPQLTHEQSFVVNIEHSLALHKQREYLDFFQNSVSTKLSESLRMRIERFFKDPHSIFIPITYCNELIAFTAVSHCVKDSMFADFFEHGEQTCAFTMAAVAKPWRGNDLYRTLNNYRFEILKQAGCTQLLTHTQNSNIMRGLMHTVPKFYPQAQRRPLELIHGMYNNSISGKQHITASDIREWGDLSFIFHPEQGDAFRLRWTLL